MQNTRTRSPLLKQTKTFCMVLFLFFFKPNEPKINEPNFEESSFRVCYAFGENLGENFLFGYVDRV